MKEKIVVSRRRLVLGGAGFGTVFAIGGPAALRWLTQTDGRDSELALQHVDVVRKTVGADGASYDVSGQVNLYNTVVLARIFLGSSVATGAFPDLSQRVLGYVAAHPVTGGLGVADAATNLEMAYLMGQDTTAPMKRLERLAQDKIKEEARYRPSNPVRADGLAWRVGALRVLKLVGAKDTHPVFYQQIDAAVRELFDPDKIGIREFLSGQSSLQQPVNDLTLVAYGLGVRGRGTEDFLTHQDNTHGYRWGDPTLTDTMGLYVQVFPQDAARREVLRSRNFAQDGDWDGPRDETLFHLNKAQALLNIA